LRLLVIARFRFLGWGIRGGCRRPIIAHSESILLTLSDSRKVGGARV
jgi:hypothetical protein